MWTSLSPVARARLEEDGFIRLAGEPRAFAISAFYRKLVCDGVPSVVTLDALTAVAFLVVEAALAEAEMRVSLPAMRTLLERLDTRLGAAEPGAHPDLAAGLHVAQGVVAVALSLLDSSYVAPREISQAVSAELALVHAHGGVARSPVLRTLLDYSTFTPRGAATGAPAANVAYVAAQWLAGASFAFDADEGTRHVDMGAARSRTRGALLVARLVMAASDADGLARDAELEMDVLAELAFGEVTSAASPATLARFALANGFDLHDASAIGDPALLDRVRRKAGAELGSMALVPLRLAPEGDVWRSGARPLASEKEPAGSDVVAWLGSPARTGETAAQHASFYASGMAAIAARLAASSSERALPAAETPAWGEQKKRGALAAWTLLRHASLPYARVSPHPPSPAELGPECPALKTQVMVEPHPEAVGALVGLVKQVSTGLKVLRALGEEAPSRDLLAEVQALLEVALAAAEDESNGSTGTAAHQTEVAELPAHIAAIEARIAPAAGPFSVVVYTDAKSGRVLEEGTSGIETVLFVVADPRTGRPELAAGAAVARMEAWVPANVDATDRDWAAHLSSPTAPAAGPPPERRDAR